MESPDSHSVDERLQRLESSVEQMQDSLRRINELLAGRAGSGQDQAAPPQQPVEPGSMSWQYQHIKVPAEKIAESKAKAEAAVAHESAMSANAPAAAAPKPPSPGITAVQPPAGTHPTRPSDPDADPRGSSYWLNKIGIGLLLLGVIFLFKYGVDRGWYTPPMRIMTGLIIGLAMVALGMILRSRRYQFSQVVTGGGLAALYITAYAAFAFYGLISYPLAFFFMALTSALSFGLSLRQSDFMLSLVAVIGAMATPLMLGHIDGLAGVVAYSCAVTAVSIFVYLFKGWRSLLQVTVWGGWLVLLYFYKLIHGHTMFVNDRWSLQVGILVFAALFWLAPLIRDVIASIYIDWDYKKTALDAKGAGSSFVNYPSHLLAVTTPLIALRFSAELWNYSPHFWGWMALAGAGAYGLAFSLLRRVDKCDELALTHALMTIALITIFLALELTGDLLFVSIVVEAFVLHLIARYFEDERVETLAHAFFAGIGVWLFVRLIGGLSTSFGTHTSVIAFFNQRALADFLAIIAGLGISLLFDDLNARIFYRLTAHIALMLLVMQELLMLGNGQAYVTVVWGVYAISLLIAGLSLDLTYTRVAGLVTLYAVVGKLMLVDLAAVATFWRIILFLGFGAIFLMLSYFYHMLVAGGSIPSKPSQESPGSAAADAPSAPPA